MYKVLGAIIVLIMVAGCTAGSKRLLASTSQSVSYGDYYLKQQPPNGVAALRLYERAAGDGDKWGQYKAAELLRSGKFGAPKDPGKAIQYYRLSSGAGNAWASFNLAKAYKDGAGVDKDMGEALKFAKLAHDQSKKVSEYFNMFLYDLLKDTSSDEARRYLIEAAEAGSKKAQDVMAGNGAVGSKDQP